ncbi:MAG TPA: ParB/RepB/Spo0J family partition protein [Syntrophomonadaceae bacterium]|nr:ParB/RepB/Spo0J family partition protein [Syntrophomonadaceae bacterium]
MVVRQTWGKRLCRDKIIEIPLTQISIGPCQSRSSLDDEDGLRELAMSIRAYGVIQPVLVRKAKKGFQLVTGQRRYRACKMIGLKSIPCMVKNIDDSQMTVISLIENLQRKELSYFEEAEAFGKLMAIYGMNHEELAQKTGHSAAYISNKLRLLQLPDEVRVLILPHKISEKHARSLLRLSSVDMQKEVARLIYQNSLSLKETEELVNKLSEHNIPGERYSTATSNHVSMIIRDVRIFINTIKETVKRAQQTGINMSVAELDRGDEYEIIIRIPKVRSANRNIS